MADMNECIEACCECRATCQETLFQHCLQQGGEHVAPEHIKLMTDCMQICQTAADFMTRGSALHAAVCLACAEISASCAASCASIGGQAMAHCAAICHHCSEICRATSRVKRAA